jgi:hypothetical protein
VEEGVQLPAIIILPPKRRTLALAVVVTMRSCSIKLAAMFRIMAER